MHNHSKLTLKAKTMKQKQKLVFCCQTHLSTYFCRGRDEEIGFESAIKESMKQTENKMRTKHWCRATTGPTEQLEVDADQNRYNCAEKSLKGKKPVIKVPKTVFTNQITVQTKQRQIMKQQKDTIHKKRSGV